MLDLDELGLDSWQLDEVQKADPLLVASWLEAASEPEIYSPTGFFLKGLRSGKPHYNGPSRTEVQELRAAEQWVKHVGHLYDREEIALDELFNERGLLRHHAEDQAVRDRMAALWRKERPRAEAMEREQTAYYEQAKEARRARLEAGTKPT